MKRLKLIAIIWLCATFATAKDYYVAANGCDRNDGSISKPFATLAKAYQTAGREGDAIYLRGGTYKITESQIMNNSDKLNARVFYFDKKAEQQHPLTISGYRHERVVFDLSAVKPRGKRVQVFYINGNCHHLKNFEVVGVQVTIKSHTQSENIRIDGGNHNVVENVAMHDGMGLGVYISRGIGNTILNCDAYNLDDRVSEGGRNENTDGFGGHPASASSTGNKFVGCRAWNCGDDGFDLIGAFAPVAVQNCWAFNNGYKKNGTGSGGNGNGFKAGGYGMAEHPRVPSVIPRHIVSNCIAYDNKAHGFYSNHHLGGITFINNSAFNNAVNYSGLNRKSASVAADVDGYGHVFCNNVSVSPRAKGCDIVKADRQKCHIENNTFLNKKIKRVERSYFESLDPARLSAPRKADGSLPDITFLKPKAGTILDINGMGHRSMLR